MKKEYLFLLFIPLTGAIFPKIQPFIENGEYNKNITVTVDNKNEYLYWFPSIKTTYPFRITAKTSYIDKNYPVMIVVTQEKMITSWEIPLVVSSRSNNYEFFSTARTLCYSSIDFYNTIYRSMIRSMFDVERKFALSITTFSPRPINVTFKASEFTDYYIKNDLNYTVIVSPSEPTFYYYSFLTNNIGNETVFIDIDSNDEHCVVVSIQNSYCPVRDLNNDITYEGSYLTINKKGALYTSRHEYPEGFFLVFVVRGDNFECSGHNSILPSSTNYLIQGQNKESILHFKVRKGITKDDYVKATMIVFGAYAGFCIFFIILTIGIYKYKNRNRSDETDKTIRTDRDPNTIVNYTETEITLVLLDTKQTNNRKASNYCYHIANIGLFYGLPVIQLMISYQRSVNMSGNQDICYHNFKCAHPLNQINDFNHIYSNIGYFLVGILFICLVTCKKWTTVCSPDNGIPKYYGLFYAMGIGLIFEGFLSACYHICPNQTNFQFDTSFMYTMAILIMIKLYQNRHPDLNATAYAAFTVLGVAVFLAMIGIMTNSKTVLVLFILFYISLCIHLSFKIYFFGQVLNTLREIYLKIGSSNQTLGAFLVPLRKRLFLLLLIANVLNYTLAFVGIYFYPQVIDFGTYLLMLLMGNAILHTIFYVGMKIYYKEKLCVEAILYGLLALACWIPSSYFFFDASTLWSVTPAESRQLNSECILFKFFDGHDIWHMLSAPALFFSFMLLMTIDDDLNDTHKININVF